MRSGPGGIPPLPGIGRGSPGRPGPATWTAISAFIPALEPLRPLWRAGELAVVQAVSTPYRDKRSHFDGQDLLEAGTNALDGTRDGWLNRMLDVVPGIEAQTAFAIGQGEMRVLDGAAPVSEWSPDAQLGLTPQALRLAERVMADDPMFHAAFAEAMMLSEDLVGFDAGEGAEAGAMAGQMMMQPPRPSRGAVHLKVAEFAAQRLAADTRVAAFSINGWDTHGQQARGLTAALGRLSETILTLRDGLGADWQKTAVVAMTEFGRTVRENGTKGTDHGTGGAMVLAGGAIRGGRVMGVWPGLAEADLYDRRDLMPTGDVRAPAAWLMRGMVGLDRATLERTVFPGLDMGSDPALLL
jgi:uncharacterized protein (DUF1501 family)